MNTHASDLSPLDVCFFKDKCDNTLSTKSWWLRTKECAATPMTAIVKPAICSRDTSAPVKIAAKVTIRMSYVESNSTI